MGDLTKDFDRSEFECKCGCGGNDMQMEFVELLQSIRTMCGHPISINSGYRCPKHDVESKGEGNHPTGMAADLRVRSSAERYWLLKAIHAHGLRRIGMGETFLHIDICQDRPQDVAWLYTKTGKRKYI